MPSQVRTRGEIAADAALSRVRKLARELEAGGDTQTAVRIRDAIDGRNVPPEQPGRLVGRGAIARWLIEDIGADVLLAKCESAPRPRPLRDGETLEQRVARMITDAMVRTGWDRSPEAMERTPPPPMPSYEIHGDGKTLFGWEDSATMRREWVRWFQNRPGSDSGLGGRPPKAKTAEEK